MSDDLSLAVWDAVKSLDREDQARALQAIQSQDLAAMQAILQTAATMQGRGIYVAGNLTINNVINSHNSTRTTLESGPDPGLPGAEFVQWILILSIVLLVCSYTAAYVVVPVFQAVAETVRGE